MAGAAASGGGGATRFCSAASAGGTAADMDAGDSVAEASVGADASGAESKVSPPFQAAESARLLTRYRPPPDGFPSRCPPPDSAHRSSLYPTPTSSAIAPLRRTHPTVHRLRSPAHLCNRRYPVLSLPETGSLWNFKQKED